MLLNCKYAVLPPAVCCSAIPLLVPLLTCPLSASTVSPIPFQLTFGETFQLCIETLHRVTRAVCISYLHSKCVMCFSGESQESNCSVYRACCIPQGVVQAVVISSRLHDMLCRSLGLTLLEAATGRYPYDAAGGPLQLMIQVIMWTC